MPELIAKPARALLVTRNFPPLVGGMENVNQRLLAELSPDWELALSGPGGSRAHAPQAVRSSETPVKPLARFLVECFFRTLVLAWRWRPSLVLAGSGLAAPMAWFAARLNGARLVVYLHGLDIIAPSAVYRRLWLPFIRRADLVFVNSAHTAGLAREIGVDPDRIQVLHPGTEMPVLDSQAGTAFRSKLELGNAPLLLSVGRLTRRKGLAEFVQQAFPRILEQSPSSLLVIIGEEATDALHSAAGSERARIMSAAEASGTAGQLRFIGRRNDADLSAAYQAAQVHVFPVLEQVGDVEGFGMVALESAAHGLPTVAFAVGGVPDAVAPGITGSLVRSGDYSGFAEAVLALLATPFGAEEVAASREFAEAKSWPHFGARLRKLVAGGQAHD